MKGRERGVLKGLRIAIDKGDLFTLEIIMKASEKDGEYWSALRRRNIFLYGIAKGWTCECRACLQHS